MLRKLDKFMPWLALALLGYLGYTSVQDVAPAKSEAKPPPVIAPDTLRPKMIQAVAHASTAGRDPFEVWWASYTTVAAEHTGSASASRPATSGPAAVSQPSAPLSPPLPRALEGVIISDDIRLAVIEEKVYKVGALVGGDDAEHAWRVEEIEQDRVTLRFGEATRVLRLEPTAAPGKAGGREGHR